MTLKVIGDGTFQKVTHHFLLVVCSNHASILYHF